MRKILLIILSIFTLSTLTFAQEKYAYVDLIKVMNDSKTGQKLKKEIEDKFKFFKSQADDIENKIEDLKKQLESPLLSDKAKSEKQAKIRELQRQLQQLTIDAQQQLNQMKSDAEKKLIEKIRLAAKEYLDKNNLDIIFTNGLYGIVLYSDNKIDITDKIIKLLDGNTNETK
jgi:outer membrane protein